MVVVVVVVLVLICRRSAALVGFNLTRRPHALQEKIYARVTMAAGHQFGRQHVLSHNLVPPFSSKYWHVIGSQ
jgi:hypothetical protein